MDGCAANTAMNLCQNDWTNRIGGIKRLERMKGP